MEKVVTKKKATENKTRLRRKPAEEKAAAETKWPRKR
jgi:hypothetical protein